MSLLASNIYTEQVNAIRLSDLLTYVRNTIKGAFGGSYWIVAEVTGLSIRRHYYFDLAEVQNGQVVAKVRGNLWESIAGRIIPKFVEATGQAPDIGMELMLLVQVEMHLQYGISLTIYDINADYTLGNLERKRKETIQKLQADGVMDLNKHNHLPLLLQRIAVITSESAAGWGDFQNQVSQSGLGSLFQIDLYPALMQGEKTTASIYQAMLQILNRISDYDALFILRGGGSKMDLAAFDDYELCSYIANFPIPVLTAIGHEQDTSIADMVAHTRLKTPTALAEFLVQRMLLQLGKIITIQKQVKALLSDQLRTVAQRQAYAVSRLQQHLYHLERSETGRLNNLCQSSLRLLHSAYTNAINRIEYLSFHFQTVLRENDRHMWQRLRDSLKDYETLLHRAKASLSNQTLLVSHIKTRALAFLTSLVPSREEQLQHMDRVANLYNPTMIMQRGFIPVLKDGASITSIGQIDPDDKIRLLLMDGEAEATIVRIQETQDPNRDE